MREWLKGLKKDVRVNVGADVQTVQRLWPIGRPLVGSFGRGMYEVVSSYDRNEFRVIFCIMGSAMVLLHGFQKKTRKTPQADIELARQRKKEIGS